jgi:D-alanyl-D-alanine carboxypeptidase/D-alanyl-D-alanine-endopeptidase (penicillin-binding protein 4)
MHGVAFVLSQALKSVLRLAMLAALPALLAPAAHAQPDERLPTSVARALKAAGVPQSAVAVLVQEVDARMPRWSFNAGQPMNPASVMKLVTAPNVIS